MKAVRRTRPAVWRWGGIQYQTTTVCTTDFALEQNLDMLVKGLRFNGTVSMDNTFIESDQWGERSF